MVVDGASQTPGASQLQTTAPMVLTLGGQAYTADDATHFTSTPARHSLQAAQ